MTNPLTVAQVASCLGVSPQRVRKLIALGRLPARRVGARLWLIEETALEGIGSRKPGRPAAEES